MSYSRVVHPRTTRTQPGRGSSSSSRSRRPPPRPVNGATLDHTSRPHSEGDDQLSSSSSTDYAAAGSSAACGEARSLQSQGSYHVLPPNPQKNAKLKRTAEREESEFERHKAQKRQETAQMLSTQPSIAVGGVSYSKEKIDRMREEQEKKQKAEARFAQVRLRKKREEYHRQQREKEEEEIRRKRQVQREKAEKLKAEKQLEQERQLEEMRRARLARFDKKN